MQLQDLICGFLLGLLPLADAKSKADSAILLSKVKTLTLYGDKQTSHRRVTPIPQLTCIGGSGCEHYKVDLMRCQNAGSEYDAEDVQWTCSASLPSEFKLGSTEVVCEGYDNADDPWILKGSCGVEYRLLLTDEGERKYASKPKSTYKPKEGVYSSQKGSSDSWQSVIARTLFWVVFVGIVCLIIYRVFVPPNPNRPVRLSGNNRPGWGGGGGGDNGPFDDPPPPYSPQAPPKPRAKSSSARASTAGSSRGNSGPGFWSGAATGGAAGYGAGYYHGSRTAEAERRQRERSRERERERARERERSRESQRQRERASSSWFSSGSGPGSGGGGGGSFFSGAGGSSPAPSGSRHESTGFGGTRRR